MHLSVPFCSRRMIRLGAFVLTLWSLAQFAAAAEKVESWADPNLKVTDGLFLWLDAAKMHESRSRFLSRLQPGDALSLWPDGSGNQRHVRQPNGQFAPTYHQTDDYQAIRFNGANNSMTWEGDEEASQDATIFIVAAPFSNSGGYPAFLSLSAPGGNDFLQGLNIDQGVQQSPEFNMINVEGVGAPGGLGNLINKSLPFGSLIRLTTQTTPGPNGISVFLNGEPQGRRDRAPGGNVHLGQITLGARYYLAFGPPAIKGFLDGDIAEVLIYDRVLSDEERQSVDAYLADKYAKTATVPLPERAVEGKPLVFVENPPEVQVLVPGFSVQRLDLTIPESVAAAQRESKDPNAKDAPDQSGKLTHINNLLYRPDGKVVALAYDGKIYLLSDTDGDGLEDKAELFWANDQKDPLRAPIGMALTPPGYSHGQGVFVAAKSKCSLIVDTDNDDVADKEIVIAASETYANDEERKKIAAEGKWIETGHGVDALGVEFDPRDGSVYFGLGTQNFTNGYLIENGVARFNLNFERGTILRIAPDFSTREIFATGIRFPVGIRLNKAGDLFCSDQEGATWLPNGNPFDELLHVQHGRHYGFPPRHPKHLPDVIDEPSVYDYRPQHQSTCGLNFNESVNGGPIFGPAWWESDVLMTGYSRGKLYRTKLKKTDVGYVATNQLFAYLDKLTVDACVAPDGSLLVATHRGPPDWGNGPGGVGEIYKITYSQPELPQPSLVWPQSQREVRVTFDRPLDPAQVAGLQSGASLEYGRYVSPGDRFLSLNPPYQVVQNQLRTPRFELPIHGVQMTPDRRTLILATGAHPDHASYALTLPGLGRASAEKSKEGTLPQEPQTDLGYDLSGVEVEWKSADGKDTWTGWLPHLDMSVAEEFTKQSVDHVTFFELTRNAGSLTLRTQFDLTDMLRPAVQPGSTIDYEWPEESVTIEFRSRHPFNVTVHTGENQQSQTTAQPEEQGYVAAITATGKTRLPVDIAFANLSGGADLKAAWHTAEDSRPRAFPLNRILLPWAPTEPLQEVTIDVASIAELQGGDWTRGRQVFLSEAALCSKCHTVRGEGGRIGPDLSNLQHRDYHSVMRDITQPSAAINPDFLTQTIALVDGRILSGTVRAEGDRLFVGDINGKVTEIARGDVDEISTAKLSVMPEKLLEKLSPEQTKDLLVYLLSGPPRMPDYGPKKPPVSRARQEVETALAGSEPLPPQLRPLQVVLVGGRKDHGPGEHDYPAWKVMWQRLMSLAPQTTVETAETWPSPEQLQSADVMVFYQQGTWTPERARDIDTYLKRGGGLVYIHYAVDGGQDAPGFAQRIGLAWKGGASAFRHGELDLGFEPSKGHPIARNFDRLQLHDESYWQLLGNPDDINLLATGVENGKDQPLFWTMEPSQGRVFVSIPGHFSWTFDDPLFRLLLLRGIAWTADEPVDRFNDLILHGARISD